MKMKSGILLVAVGATLACGPVDAGEWFLGGALGTSGIDEVFDLSGTLSTLDDSDTSFRFFGGYQFNGYFGLEGGYIDFGQVGLNFSSGIGPIVASASADGFTLAGIGSVPIGERFSLHARFGAVMWDADSSVRVGGVSISGDDNDDDGTDAFFGVGFGVRLGKQWDLMADYEQYDLDDVEPDVFSVSLRYRF
jgi:OOP family OmpA-OmpF porin